MKKVKNIIRKLTSIQVISVFIFIALFIIPPIIKKIFDIPALFSFFGFVDENTKSAWIGYFGSILGGAFTLGGVWWTLNTQRKEKKEEFLINNCPLVVFNYNLVKSLINYDCSENNLSVSFTILGSIKLLNDIPANSFKYIGNTFSIDKSSSHFSINNLSKNKDYLKSCDDKIYVECKVNIKDAFTLNRDWNGKNKINTILYFSFKNIYGYEYILKLNHVLTYKPENENKYGYSPFQRDVYPSIIYKELEIAKLKKELRNN